MLFPFKFYPILQLKPYYPISIFYGGITLMDPIHTQFLIDARLLDRQLSLLELAMYQ